KTPSRDWQSLPTGASARRLHANAGRQELRQGGVENQLAGSRVAIRLALPRLLLRQRRNSAGLESSVVISHPRQNNHTLLITKRVNHEACHSPTMLLTNRAMGHC